MDLLTIHLQIAYVIPVFLPLSRAASPPGQKRTGSERSLLAFARWDSWGRLLVSDSRVSVEVRGPVDHVEAPEQNGKHDAGHAVDSADAVEGLLALLGLGRCSPGGGGGGGGGGAGRGGGGQWAVLRVAGGVVGHSHSVSVVPLQCGGSFLLLWRENKRS